EYPRKIIIPSAAANTSHINLIGLYLKNSTCIIGETPCQGYVKFEIAYIKIRSEVLKVSINAFDLFYSLKSDFRFIFFKFFLKEGDFFKVTSFVLVFHKVVHYGFAC